MRESSTMRWLRRLGLLGFALIVGVPCYVMVTTSIRPLADVDDPFRWLPDRVTLRPYLDMWSTVPLGRYLRNSLLVAVATAALALLVAVPAAYATARTSFVGRRSFLILLLAVQAVPGVFFLVPLFVLYAGVGDWLGIELIGGLPVLVLTDLTITVPLATWMLATQLASFARELEEAARIDGAGLGRLLWHVVLPVAAPGIAAVGLLAFVIAWGEVVFASVLTQNDTNTVPVGLELYATQSGVLWNQLTAAALVSALPAAAGFVAVRRLLARLLRF